MRWRRLPAGGGHVAQLRRGSGEDGLGENSVVAPDGGVVRDVGVAGEGAEEEASVGRGLDVGEGEAVDVDEGVGALDVELHHVDEVGAAGEDAGLRINGLIGRGGAGELELLHIGTPGVEGEWMEAGAQDLLRTCCTAAMMLG